MELSQAPTQTLVILPGQTVPAPQSLYLFRARNLHGSCTESLRKSGPTLSVWGSTWLKPLGGPSQGQIIEKCTEATRVAESDQLTGLGTKRPVWKTTASESFGKLALESVSTHSALLIESNTREEVFTTTLTQQILLSWARHWGFNGD